MDPIAEESLKELKRIFAWITEREGHLDRPITILVGGWAVYSYNGYWGSVDRRGQREKDPVKQTLRALLPGL
jgi:hypothetical protein